MITRDRRLAGIEGARYTLDIFEYMSLYKVPTPQGGLTWKFGFIFLIKKDEPNLNPQHAANYGNNYMHACLACASNASIKS